MRTTITLDDELLAKARAYTGLEEKTALVREALKALIQREAAKRLANPGANLASKGHRVAAATMTKTGSVSHQTVDQIKIIEAPVNGDAPNTVDEEAKVLTRSLPGVESVADEDGAMIIRFSDGTEATVVRSFLAWAGDPTFEL